MATIVNARDIQLQATSPRMVNVSANDNLIIPGLKGINLTSPGTNFQVDATGTIASPTSFLMTAVLLQTAGTVTFTITGGVATLTGSGNTRTLAFSDVTTFPVTVRASVVDTLDGLTYSSSITFTEVQDGYDAAAYWIAGPAAITQNTDGSFTPSSVTFSALAAVGGITPAAYPGRFIIATSPDGGTYTDQYTSSADETSKTYTGWPAGTATLRVRLYKGGGTTTLVDEEIIPIVIDGTHALTVILSNDSHTLPAGSNGAVSSYTGSGTTIEVWEGTTKLTYVTSGPTAGQFTIGTAVVSPASSITVGAYSGNGTTTATVAQHASMTNATLALTITYPLTVKRADNSSVSMNAVQSITKAKAGVDGSNGSDGFDGVRGSVTLYTSGSSWSDATANSAITAQTGSSTKVIGDTVTISNGTNFAGTKYWDGTAWADPGVVINGNLLVTGSVAASKINATTLSAIQANLGTVTAGTISGTADINITGNARFKGAYTGGDSAVVSAAVYANESNTAITGVYGRSNATVAGAGSSGVGVRGYGAGTDAIGGIFVADTNHGVTGTTGGTGDAVHGTATSSSGNGGHFANSSANTSGRVGAGNGWNFYADGSSASDYGTFTGGHDAVMLLDDFVEEGDIVVDAEIVAKFGMSMTISRVTRSTRPNQKGVAGAFAGAPSNWDEFTPTALYHCPDAYYAVKDTTRPVIYNALGEGQINVCGEGGDIENGDLIVSSSTPGKGMKQADDIIRSYTVAKCRERVTFSSPDEVKQVACYYVSG